MTGTEHCALCGMEIAADPVVLDVGGQEVHCDTDDCARLYRAAYDAGLLDEVLSDAPEHRLGLIERLGLHTRTVYFILDGMWCAACAKVAQKLLARADGVTDAQVSFAAGKGRIDFDPRVADPEALLLEVEKLGYRARLIGDAASEETSRAEEGMLLQVIVAFAFGMQEMALYLVRLYPAYGAGDFSSQQVRLLQLLALLLAVPALVYGGRTFLLGAFGELRARMPGMDTLVALGTLSAFLYSAWATAVGGHATYFDSVTMIVQFIVLGRYIEMAGGARARKDVRGLLELQPQVAWVRSGDGRLEEVPARQVTAGATIVAKPGERIPLDATVTEGAGHADEALLTGESMPVAKGAGDTAWAGTLLLDGSLTARVERDLDSSRLSSIRTLVEHTLAEQAPAQRLADRAALALTIGVIALALATGAFWAATGAGTAALITAVAVLVVACPCALGLATPLAISIALGGSAREGVLVRNGAALESAGLTTTVALDKTGTVTLGRLAVAGSGGDAHERLLALASAAEQFSEHPLARAVAAAVPAPPAASQFTSVPGKGVSAVLAAGGAVVRVGRAELLPEPPGAGLAREAAAREADGETVVWVSEGDRTAGFIALRDEIDPTARRAVRDLLARGTHVTLLSGDSEATTRAMAAELGIDSYAARLSPEAKADEIARLQAAGEKVAMVGDGVNDAPSLAKADISVTVAGGADVAGQTSDVVFDREDLALLPWFLAASTQTRRVIRQNLAWAFAYNAVALPLAALGRITPAIAAIAMAGSSLLVVGNSLRLRGQLRRITEAERQPAMTADAPAST